jgi:hypothetical protein
VTWHRLAPYLLQISFTTLMPKLTGSRRCSNKCRTSHHCLQEEVVITSSTQARSTAHSFKGSKLCMANCTLHYFTLHKLICSNNLTKNARNHKQAFFTLTHIHIAYVYVCYVCTYACTLTHAHTHTSVFKGFGKTLISCHPQPGNSRN